MGQRQARGHHTRFQTWTQKGVKDHLADTADLPQTGEQKQGRLQHLSIHHRMRLGHIAQVSDMLRNDAAQKGKPQIGPHGLRHGDPIVTRSTFHRFKPLINNHADGLIMGRQDGRAAGVMGIPRPFRAARQAGGINAQKITGPFDVIGCHLGRNLLRMGGRLPVLQKHKGTEQPALRRAGRSLARVVTRRGALLQRRSHIAKLRAGEHIRAFGHPGHIRLINIGRGGLNAL